MLGWWGLAVGSALGLGPLAGGPLTDAFGWSAIFLVYAVIAGDLVAGLVAVVALAAFVSATVAGVRMLPYVLANVFAAFCSGRLAARFGAARVLPVGRFVAALGGFAFLMLDAASPYWLLAPVFAVAGLGVGLSVTPTNIVGLAGLPGDRVGIASATGSTPRWAWRARRCWW
ncbi:hypothetical protein [Amycolatopsis saalfeldensis]|uniref:Major Facilitator Superfamily protein n=1 Tax=Amycolatopsis saalfeldensis TaxID=394193 RepID=A0A1H8YJJ0_9PSEU|nr:hypothetical protein [Amycolatopsis saalfeldensis]SEP52309.1 hypothetical protein SAMN04489732_119191 [Amycolatopsis saalfeldensis]